MICTVTTAKDTFANIHEFVCHNLRSGVDHMFVFLDDTPEEFFVALKDLDHVTAVHADSEYWGANRPSHLNDRQKVNANLINCLLASLANPPWLFHIDVDECLEIDREAFDALPDDVRTVRLEPRETPSTDMPSASAPPRFKRLLSQDDLHLLSALDVIEYADNRKYFTGHVIGKSGLIPSFDHAIGIHDVNTRDGQKIVPYRAEWLTMLHYEAASPQEFLAKWRKRRSASSLGKVREDKRQLVGAIRSLTSNTHLDGDQIDALLLDLYRKYVADDVATLSELGLLEPYDEAKHRYRSAALEPATLSEIDRLLPILTHADKQLAHPRHGVDGVATLMGAVVADLKTGDGRRDGNRHLLGLDRQGRRLATRISARLEA